MCADPQPRPRAGVRGRRSQYVNSGQGATVRAACELPHATLETRRPGSLPVLSFRLTRSRLSFRDPGSRHPVAPATLPRIAPQQPEAPPLRRITMRPMKFFIDTHDHRSNRFPAGISKEEFATFFAACREAQPRGRQRGAARPCRIRGRPRILLQHGAQRGARPQGAREGGIALRQYHRGRDRHARRPGVVLSPGSHPFIRHETVVHFSNGMVVRFSDLEAAVLNGEACLREGFRRSF